VVITDLTAQKRHQELVTAEALAKERAIDLAEANRRKDEFLAMLAHELRNPLAPIRNGIDVLRTDPPDREQAKQLLGMMGDQVNNLVRLVDDLLDVSRCTRGKLELRRQRVALTKIITSAVQTAQPLIHANGHELTVTQARENLYVHGDTTRLTQVVSNLLNNAAKYTYPCGNILLTTEKTGDNVAIRVKDNGTGIASDMLPHIFDMFVQADNSLTRTHGGLGIGLTLVKNLVEMHGGTVEVTSDGPGKGCEFTVRLPILQATDVACEESTDLPERSFPCHSILIVDDLEPSALILAILLRSWDQNVRTAASGEEALAMIEQEKPELLLSDISMPGMTGYELAQEIRRRPEWNDISLVAVTGFGDEIVKRQTKEAGFSGHVVKPISEEDLERLLASL
jgi:CheY-like chemotaxis protein